MKSPENFKPLIGKTVILVRLGGELGVKSRRTRSRMVKQLIRNLQQCIVDNIYTSCNITLYRDRLVIWTETQEVDWNPLVNEIATIISGVSSLSIATIIESTKENLIPLSYGLIKNLLKSGTAFAVRVRREGKHPYSSVDIAKELGARILDSSIPDLRVNLDNPDLEIFLDIRGDLAFVFTEIVPAMDGIPSKAQGKAIVLFKSHYNSILAGILMKKRGVEIIPVYFKTGHKLNQRFQDNIKQFFPQEMKTLDIEAKLRHFKANANLCFQCQAYCEAICQQIAAEENIKTIISPTCFDFNNEKISLAALEYLESKSKLPILRPLQFGYYGEKFELNVSKTDPCCPYREFLNISIPESPENQKEEFYRYAIN